MGSSIGWEKWGGALHRLGGVGSEPSIGWKELERGGVRGSPADVLVHQALDDFTRLLKLLHTVREHGFLLVVVEEGAAFVQRVELLQRRLEH